MVADQLNLIRRYNLMASEVSHFVMQPNKTQHAKKLQLTERRYRLRRVRLRDDNRPFISDIELREEVALGAFRCDPLMEKLERFILQQDEHGWVGMFEQNCGSVKYLKHIYRRDHRMKPRGRPRKDRLNSMETYQ